MPLTVIPAWRQSWLGVPLVEIALLCLLSFPTSAQVTQPRLTGDGKMLILLEEILEPPERRQPLVTIEFSPNLGTPQVRVAGKGILAPASLKLVCGSQTWTLGRSDVLQVLERTHVFFGVAKEAAEAALTWPECRLMLVGAQIPIPRDLLWAVWADPARGKRPPRLLEGRVVSVTDGDTVRVQIDGREDAVRYIGVNTPEVHHPAKGEQPGGREAMEVNRSLVQGLTVRLELDVQERDRYGRLLAYVHVGDMMVNAELARRGYAQVMTVPPNIRYQERFLALQREAREQKRGLWAEPEPTGTTTQSPPSPVVQGTQGRPGVESQDAWTCPATHPIKGNFTTYSGERCIYHVPGGQFYGKTKPERCYATEDEGRKDGCRRSRR